MYIIIAPLQVKEQHKDEFIEAMLDDARGSVGNEPGCLRFDVIQDAGDANRIWVYEVYIDEGAFQAHLESPHFLQWMLFDPVRSWNLLSGPIAMKNSCHMQMGEPLLSLNMAQKIFHSIGGLPNNALKMA